MIGRIVRSADFERVLGSPSRARSSHFAVHHVAALPSQPGRRLSTRQGELSTTHAPDVHKPVDTLPPASPAESAPVPVQGHWLGTVVPKRHARRAVTRSLLKRLIRVAFSETEAAALPPGLWVVRLRAPFDRKLFPSASSDALRAAVRAELQQLMHRLTRPARAPAGSSASSASA